MLTETHGASSAAVSVPLRLSYSLTGFALFICSHTLNIFANLEMRKMFSHSRKISKICYFTLISLLISVSNPRTTTAHASTNFNSSIEFNHAQDVNGADLTGASCRFINTVNSSVHGWFSLSDTAGYRLDGVGSGTLYKLEILWQGNKVNETYYTTSNTSGVNEISSTIKCRVGRLTFSLRHSGGEDLYVSPSRFKVQSPNGTTLSISNLTISQAQNGTWNVREIYWQSSNIVPETNSSLAFNGTTNYTWNINCRIYKLIIQLINYNGTPISYSPVLSLGSAGSWDSRFVANPCVIKNSTGTFMMYYGGYNDTSYSIGLATSTDGVTWTKYIDNPILTPGSAGLWDDTWVELPWVILIDGIYHMFYIGRNSSQVSSVGYASSTNGINFTKYAGNPVLSPASGWDSAVIRGMSVLYEDGVWHMWYSGSDTVDETFQIGYANSTNKFTWTKCIGNPIFTFGAAGSWDDRTVFCPRVYKIGSTYNMFYAAKSRNTVWGNHRNVYEGSSWRIGLAASSNRLNWMRNECNPIISAGFYGMFDDTGVSIVSMISVNNSYYVYYEGQTYESDKEYWRIGLLNTSDLVTYPQRISYRFVAPNGTITTTFKQGWLLWAQNGSWQIYSARYYSDNVSWTNPTQVLTHNYTWTAKMLSYRESPYSIRVGLDESLLSLDTLTRSASIPLSEDWVVGGALQGSTKKSLGETILPMESISPGTQKKIDDAWTMTVSLINAPKKDLFETIFSIEAIDWLAGKNLIEYLVHYEQTSVGQQTTATIIFPWIVTEINPFIINATKHSNTILLITGISKAITVTIRSDTAPKQTVPDDLTVVGRYVEIMVSEPEMTINAVIRIYYDRQQLLDHGLDEGALEIYYWNDTGGQWKPLKSFINKEELFVSANVSHTSYFVLAAPTPIHVRILQYLLKPWFMLIILIAILFYIKKRTSIRTTPSHSI